MLGSIIGDIVGSPYEFANIHTTRFPLFSERSSFTDDTICTIAIADALVSGSDFGSKLREWGRRYPNPMGGYGGSFAAWLRSDNPQPYNSWGNGAAMRVSPVAWAYGEEDVVLRAALASAGCTHNHMEGLIGASVVALAIFRLRDMGYPSFHSARILNLLYPSYGLDWEKDLPLRGEFDETCRGCVPLAFSICCKASSFEDAICRAVAYGGDSDTLAAIVGSLAEARWGIPPMIKKKALSFLPDDMRAVIDEFSKRFCYEI